MREVAQSPRVLAQFGKYLLDEEIARGGMARVCLARLRGLGGFEKTLVVKQILPELARDPRFVAMFVEEAKTLVRMGHPNIVPVWDVGIVDGVYYLAMEYIEGATLSQIAGDGRALSPPEVAHVAIQIADALHYAHSKFSVVHRDVTPRNVIVDIEGHARLLDFGIAAPAEVSTTGHAFGSHGYMSPEQARGQAIGPSTDIFSFAIVLYEALTGEAAFLRKTIEATSEALLDSPHPTLKGREGIPVDLAALVDEMMQIEPEKRPTPANVARRLRGYLAIARPEGCAAEVATRALSALEKRKAKRGRPVSADVDEDGEPKEPSHVVRTIATSPMLDAMLEGSVAPLDTGNASQTRPLVRPTEPLRDEEPDRPSEPELESTVALPARARAAERAATSGELDSPTPNGTTRVAPRTSHVPDPTMAAPRSSSRGAFVAGLSVAVLGVILAVGIPQLLPSDDGPTLPRAAANDAPVVPTPPEVTRPPRDAPNVPSEAVHPQPPEIPEVPTPPERGEARPGQPAPIGTHVPRHTRDPVRTVVGGGSVTINAAPWGQVRLDGRTLGDTPRRSVSLAAGSHSLDVYCPPLDRRERVTFQVREGQNVSVFVNLQTTPARVTIR